MSSPTTALIPVNTPFLLPSGKVAPEWWTLFQQLATGFVDVVTVTGSANAGDVAIFANGEQITGGLVKTANLETSAVTTPKIADTAVTLAKVQHAAASSKLLGSGASGSGSAYSELTLGTNLSITGTTLNAADTDTGITQLTGDVTAGPGNGSQAATIANSAVTYAKIQNVSATDKVLGRSTAGAGVVEEIATTGSGNVVRATSPTLTTPVIASMVSGGKTVTVTPATGSLPIIISNSGVASTATSSLIEVNLQAVTIPAGIMGANGALIIDTLWKFVGTNGTKTPIVRHNTSSGATSGGTTVLSSAIAAGGLTLRTILKVANTNSASAQIMFPSSQVEQVQAVTTATSSGAIDTASDSYINLNGLVANASDTLQLVSSTVLLYPGV